MTINTAISVALTVPQKGIGGALNLFIARLVLTVYKKLRI